MKYYDITEEEITIKFKADKEMVNLGCIDFDDYDFDSPIQRKGDLWKRKYKVDLIISILKGIPCGSVHLVRKVEGETNMWVLDAKQRLLTIKSFKNNEFSIKIKTTEGKIANLYWKNILNDIKWKNLKTKFNQYQIQLMTYPPMNNDEMLKLFKSINNQVAPNQWEKIYSANYLTKLFLEYVYTKYFKAKKRLDTSVEKDKRHAGIRLVHNILYICNGNYLDDNFAPRGLSAKIMITSASRIQKKLLENKIDANTQYDSDLIKRLNLKEITEEIKTVTNWFDMALYHKNSLIKSKQMDVNLVLDIICFFIKKNRENILTNAYVEQNYEKISNFIIKWNDYKDQNKELKERSTQESNIRKRIELMEEILRNCDIDLSEKNKKLTKSQKRKAALESEKYCPMNEVELTDKTAEMDHVDSSATTGDSKRVAVLSKPMNRIKSGTTQEFNKNLSERVFHSY